MERKTFKIVQLLLALQAVTGATLPLQQQQQPQQQQTHLPTIHQNVEDPSSFILGEGLVEAELKIKPSSINLKDEQLELIDPNYTSYNNKKNKRTAIEVEEEPNAKSENDAVDFESEDELIKPEKLTEPTNLNSDNNKRTTLRLPTGGALNVASANPIYITIPIYISKSNGQPLKLSVGGQDIPVGPKEPGPKVPGTNVPLLPPSHYASISPQPQQQQYMPIPPTSQYNRLLQHYDEAAVVQQTNTKKHTKLLTRKTSNNQKKKKARRTSSTRLAARKSHQHHQQQQQHHHHHYNHQFQNHHLQDQLQHELDYHQTLALDDPSNQSVYYKFNF